MTTQRVTRIIRDAEFVAVGVCEDGAIRLICKGARSVTFPKAHALHADALALVEIEDTELFESAVMGWIYT